MTRKSKDTETRFIEDILRNFVFMDPSSATLKLLPGPVCDMEIRDARFADPESSPHAIKTGNPRRVAEDCLLQVSAMAGLIGSARNTRFYHQRERKSVILWTVFHATVLDKFEAIYGGEDKGPGSSDDHSGWTSYIVASNDPLYVILDVDACNYPGAHLSYSYALAVRHDAMAGKTREERAALSLRLLREMSYSRSQSYPAERYIEVSSPLQVEGSRTIESLFSGIYGSYENIVPFISNYTDHEIRTAIQKLPDILASAKKSHVSDGLRDLVNVSPSIAYVSGVAIRGIDSIERRLKDNIAYVDYCGGPTSSDMKAMVTNYSNTISPLQAAIYDALLVCDRPVVLTIHFDDVRIERVDNVNLPESILMGNYVVLVGITPNGKNVQIRGYQKNSSSNSCMSRIRYKGSRATPHPHMLGSAICLGSYDRLINSCFLEGEYSTAISLMRSLLETVNTRSTYQSIESMLTLAGMVDEYVGLCLSFCENSLRINALVSWALSAERRFVRDFLVALREIREDGEEQLRITKVIDACVSAHRLFDQKIPDFNNLIGEPRSMEDILYLIERIAAGEEILPREERVPA